MKLSSEVKDLNEANCDLAVNVPVNVETHRCK
jgi:hypothetical protein